MDDVQVVTFDEPMIVTDDQVQAIGKRLYSLVEEQGYSKLVLNFSNVQHLSSAALGKLFQLKKKVEAVNGTVKLCCVRPNVQEVFKITRLDQVFPIYKDEQEAVASFF